ncbi:MAG: hypothetical protein K8S25_09290 [Alphaproteobacteria bacterium]|nr:hypothetical protein [Alphaproteobacteria bacterium]
MATPATEALQSLEERKAHRRARRLDPTAASPTTASADTDEQELINRVEQENPIFKAFEDKTLSQHDKIKAIAKLLEFDPAEPDNDKRIEVLGAFFEYVQLQRRNMALGQINTVSDQAYATFKQNMDGVFEGLNTFKGSLAPLDEILGLLKKFRSTEGVGKKSVIEQINDAFRQQKMLKEARQSRNQDIAQLTSQATRLRSDRGILQSTLNQNNTFFGRLLRSGLLADTKTGIAQADSAIAALEGKIADLKAAPLFLPGTTTPIDQKTLDMEQQNPEILKVLDIGGELFGKNMKTAADTGVSFIKEAEERIGASVEGFTKIRENILQLNYQNNKLSILLAVIHKAMELAAKQNKEVVGGLIEKFGNPDAPEQKPGDAAPSEDLTADIERTKARNRIQNMNRFLARLGDLDINLTRSIGEMSQQGAVITDLERKNSSAINYAMSIRSQTIATTSTRVVTLLNSIVNTVLTEKASLIEDALDNMSQEASMVLTDEIRNTPQLLKKRRGALEGQITDIEDLSDAVSETTATLIDVLKQTKTLADEVQRSAKELDQITLQSTRAELDAQKDASPAVEAGTPRAKPAAPTGKKGIDALFDN